MSPELVNAVVDTAFEVALRDPSNEAVVRNAVRGLAADAMSIVVDDDISYKKITSFYRQAREWKKSIDSRRKELSEPFRKEVSRINDRAKELTDPLDSVIDIANAKANSYLVMLEQAKKKEDEKLREACSLFDTGEDLYIPAMDKTVRGDGAVTITKKEMHFRVTDIAKVPARYLAIDEDAVKRDIKLGLMEIPGLEIYEETKTQLRIR